MLVRSGGGESGWVRDETREEVESLESGPGAACMIYSVCGLVVWGVPTFERGEGAETPRVGDAVAEGAIVRCDVSGANANEEVHVYMFGEGGADTGPGVVVWDGWTIGQDVVAGREGVMILGLVGPLFFLFPLHPLSLLTHLGPLPSDSHRPYLSIALIC